MIVERILERNIGSQSEKCFYHLNQYVSRIKAGFTIITIVPMQFPTILIKKERDSVPVRGTLSLIASTNLQK